MRLDGYREALERRTIFLVKTGESEVAAFDATCTHLGCLVAWDSQAQVFKCPCHGGIYDRTGAVKEVPPRAAGEGRHAGRGDRVWCRLVDVIPSPTDRRLKTCATG
jgi:Rieske Fe-S protein